MENNGEIHPTSADGASFEKPKGMPAEQIDIQDITEIMDHYPFNAKASEIGDRKLHTFLDFDMVLSHPFQRTSRRDRILRVATLRRIAERSDALTFNTSRFNPSEKNPIWKYGLKSVFDKKHTGHKPISMFPFLSEPSQRRLATLVHAVNPVCDVDFQVGIEKMTKPEIFANRVHDLLVDGTEVAIVGSSKFDRRGVGMVRQLAQERGNEAHLANLHYFDTGHRYL